MTKAEQNAFLEAMAPAARQAQQQSGIPACITLAQAILESAWGQSQLARQCNNFFGIKLAKHETADYQEFKTKEFANGRAIEEIDKFRKFASAQACFARHTQLIAGLSRYKAAMQACGDPLKFAAEMQIGGYSTDPQYADKLINLVRQYGLDRYDVKEAA